jgi:hypothetical protein
LLFFSEVGFVEPELVIAMAALEMKKILLKYPLYIAIYFTPINSLKVAELRKPIFLFKILPPSHPSCYPLTGNCTATLPFHLYFRTSLRFLRDPRKQ